jgi:hypothetical protein
MKAHEYQTYIYYIHTYIYIRFNERYDTVKPEITASNLSSASFDSIFLRHVSALYSQLQGKQVPVVT